MKKLLMVIPLAILLCFTFGCEQEDDDELDEPQKAKIVETIKKLTGEIFEAGNRDLDEMYNYFSDNTIAIENGKINYSWEEHKKNAHEMMASIVESKFTMSEIEVDVLSDDVAVVYGLYSYMMKDKSDNTFEGENAQTWVFNYEEDRWKIRHVHVSAPPRTN